MDYIDILKSFDAYIEEHLGDEDLIERAIEVTYLSKFHFYRLFKAVTNLSISGYILEKRLIQVMKDLSVSSNILKVAVDNGFNSNEVMTRNFKKRFGLTPSGFKKLSDSEKNEMILKNNTIQLAFDYLTLDLKHHKGQIESKGKFFQFEQTRFIGKKRVSDDSKVLSIPEFVSDVASQIDFDDIITEDAVYRICYDIDYSKELPTFTEFVGVKVIENSQAPNGFESLVLDSFEVCEFTHIGPLFTREKVPIIKSYELIYKYRLPALGIFPTDQYYIERYGNEFYGPFHPDSLINIMMTYKNLTENSK